MDNRLGRGTVFPIAVLAAAFAFVRCGSDDSSSAGSTGAAGATTGSSSGAAGTSVSTGSPSSTSQGQTSSTGSAGGQGTGGASTGGAGGSAGGTGGGANGGARDAGNPVESGGENEAGRPDGSNGDSGQPPGVIQYVFLVLEENHDWTATKMLPYIQHLLQLGAHSEQYYNPKGLHPSEPNYIWIEAGNNYGLTTDNDPSAQNLITNTAHLSKLLDAAGISWTSYQEGIDADTCPISTGNGYAAKHNPFVFFDDVSGNPPSAMNQHCRDHHKPFTKFLPDLKAGNVARFNFITPNLQDDMHDGTPAQGDTWLSNNIDPIINPLNPNHNAAVYARSVVFITWDEGTGTSDGPIGFIAVSPYAKVGFTDTTAPMPYYYTHSSLTLTLQEIFGVAASPLGGAATARDLSSLFIQFP
jgi:hypothetical protein